MFLYLRIFKSLLGSLISEKTEEQTSMLVCFSS